MTRASWDPFREMESLRREIDRLFSGVSGRGGLGRISFLPGLSARAYPLLRVQDEAAEIKVEALAPGLDLEALQVSVINDQLRIEGRKVGPQDVKPEAWHRSERSAGSFVRTLTLPAPIEPDQIEAEYRNGILTIRLPKAAHARPRQINVKVA